MSIPYASLAFAAGHVIGAVTSALGQDLPFLVYENYELYPSDTPESPTLG